MSLVILSGPTPWSTEPESKAKGEIPKATRNRAAALGRHPVVHPIFQTFSELIADPYWKDLFTNASKGSLPRGFMFYDCTLSHRIRTKITNIYVDKTNPEVSMVAVKRFFMEKGRSLGSERDNETKLPDRVESPPIDSWTKLRGHTSKEIAVARYISSMTSLMKLNDIQKSKLSSTVWIGILANYFNSATIKVIDGCINSIDGLKVTETGDFYIDVTVVHNVPKKSRRGEEDIQSLLSTVEDPENIEDTHRPTIHNQWSSFFKNWDKRTRAK